MFALVLLPKNGIIRAFLHRRQDNNVTWIVIMQRVSDADFDSSWGVSRIEMS